MKVVKNWNKLPREVTESLSLEILTIQLYNGPALSKGTELRDHQRSLTTSTILQFHF